MNKVTSKEIDFQGKKLIVESGELAMMATNAVKLTYGETTVLATVVVGEADKSIDFFDLRVHYDPKLFAAGLIKSSKYVKRDGRPNDEAVITRRLIDHAIRPLFPKDFNNAVQVIVTVLSLDPESDPEFASLMAVSAVLHSSTIPFYGPMTSLKVGLKDSKIIINPGKSETHHSDLNMIISFSGLERNFLAVEAEANIVNEEKLIEVIQEASDSCKDLVTLLEDFAKEVNPTGQKMDYVSNKIPDEVVSEISDFAFKDLNEIFRNGLNKVALFAEIKHVQNLAYEKFADKFERGIVDQVFETLNKKILQQMILEDGKRPDGRGQFDIRPLSSKVSYLPRVHGSGLFSRGVTQALSVATLGSLEDALVIQDFYGEETKYYIHHYSFPPYSSGEIGKTGGAGGREIGHGMLAERGLKAVIPSIDEFPYTIIVNTEITSSSGSTSMAAACGSCLALMDAGVPLKDMVAGIGVGLVVNDDFSKYKIITDIAFLEDAGGFMDFKMIGTREGVTAIQCDIKLKGIPMNLMPEIIRQSRTARLQVLDHMSQTISEPKRELSPSVPKYDTIQISPEKIGIVIGSGGKTIKDIQSKTETVLSIDDSGKIVITGHSQEGILIAKGLIEGLTKEIKAGEVYPGKVIKVVEFGAFVEILPGKEGLLHVSEISNDFVKDVKSVIKEGDEFEVMVKSVENGKISLSKKALMPKENLNN